MRVMPIFLPLRSAPLLMRGFGEQGKNHLVRCRADPDKVGALRPSRHHRRRRQMTELNFAGEKCLDCGGAAADVNQIGVEAMFLEMTFLMGQPERADARRERAVSGANRRQSVLCGAVGQIATPANMRDNSAKTPPSFRFDSQSLGFGCAHS